MSVESFVLVFLILGSPALGLESLLIGSKGGFKNFDKKSRTLLFSTLSGIIIVGIPIAIIYSLGLNMLYIIVSSLIMTFCIGGIFSILLPKNQNNISPKDNKTEGEIEEMLKNRGLNSLMKDTKSTQKGE